MADHRFTRYSFQVEIEYDDGVADARYDEVDEGVYLIDVLTGPEGDQDIVNQLKSDDYDSLEEFANAVLEVLGQDVYDLMIID